MKEIQATLECSCGRSVAARSRDAGGTIVCSCGKAVAVPRLSELRALAGADPYVTNPADAIRKQYDQGIDPAGGACLVCGSLSAEKYTCRAICESSHVKRGNGADTTGMLSFLFLPHLIMWCLYFFRSNQPQESLRRGHDIEVTFNLPVCDRCAATTGNVTRAAVAKKLMQQVPAYKDLIDFYPELKLDIERSCK